MAARTHLRSIFPELPPWTVHISIPERPVSNQWARYLLNYLYAVSDDDYDDDDEVCVCALVPSLLLWVLFFITFFFFATVRPRSKNAFVWSAVAARPGSSRGIVTLAACVGTSNQNVTEPVLRCFSYPLLGSVIILPLIHTRLS